MTAIYTPSQRRLWYHAILMVISLNACIFLPSVLHIGGVLTQTSLGLFLYSFLLLYAVSLGWQADALHVQFPSKALFVPLVVMLTAWFAWQLLNFNPLAAKLALGIGASLFELLAIYWAALHTGTLVGLAMNIKLARRNAHSETR